MTDFNEAFPTIPDATGYSEDIPVTGNDNVPDPALGTTDISGKSIPAKSGQGAKL
jgi:hypothetical protein